MSVIMLTICKWLQINRIDEGYKMIFISKNNNTKYYYDKESGIYLHNKPSFFEDGKVPFFLYIIGIEPIVEILLIVLSAYSMINVFILIVSDVIILASIYLMERNHLNKIKQTAKVYDIYSIPLSALEQIGQEIKQGGIAHFGMFYRIFRKEIFLVYVVSIVMAICKGDSCISIAQVAFAIVAWLYTEYNSSQTVRNYAYVLERINKRINSLKGEESILSE